jgi:plastocyanin
MRRLIFAIAVSLFAISLGAETVTLPAVASIQGQAPFFSDVRAFNTSYTASLDVTANYHCFIPSPCTGVGAASVPFTLAPRESRAFDDIVVNTFQAANTAGGVEFDFSGSSGQLVITSRLYSTQPEPTVGMFIPGLPDSEAHPTTVLTSIRNAGAGAGFRTNVGVYNREDSTASVTFTIFDGGVQVGNPVPVNVAGHSGAQVNRIFDIAGAVGHATSNAVIVVNSSVEIFSYAAVIDNNTSDPIFVIGAEDQAPQAVHANRSVEVGQGGGMVFVDTVSGSSITTINVGDTVTWTWSGTMSHGIQSGNCMGSGGGGGGYVTEGYGGGDCTPSSDFASGTHAPPYQFSRTFTTAGSFPYYCTVHEAAMKGRVVVNPSGNAIASKRRRRY